MAGSRFRRLGSWMEANRRRGGGSLPPVAVSLSAVAGDGEVELEWEASGGAGGPYTCDIYRHTSTGFTPPGTGTLVADDDADGAHTDDTVSNGTTYYYRAIASDVSGNTGLSAEQSAVPAAPVAAGLTATAGDGEVVLDWSGSGGVGPYTCDIHRSTSPGFTPSAGNRIAANETDGSYTDSAVSNGTTYYYVAVVMDSLGSVGSSDEESASPASSFDPLALSSPVVIADSRGDLFQLADGTSPATTDGQAVGSLMDLTGNHLLTATVGTNNPSLKIVGTTPVLNFAGGASSGVRDRLQKNLTSTNPTAFTLHYLVQIQNSASSVILSLNSSGSGPWVANRSSGSNEMRWNNASSTSQDIVPFLHYERWVHVAWVFDTVANTVRVYIDGLPIFQEATITTAWTRTAIVLGGAYSVAQTVQYLAHAAVYDAAHTDAEVLDYFGWLADRFPELIGVPTDLIMFHGSSSLCGAHLGAGLNQNQILPRGAWELLDTPRPQFLVCANGGWTMATLASNFGTYVGPHLLRATGKKVLVVTSPMRNSLVNDGLTPAQAYTALRDYCSAAKAAVAGLKIGVQTLTPSASVTPTQRGDLNTLIKTGAGLGTDYDEVVAVDVNTTIGDDGDETNTTYYLGDQIHLNHNGNAVADDYYDTPLTDLLA